MLIVVVLGVKIYFSKSELIVWRIWVLPLVLGIVLGALVTRNSEDTTVFSGEFCVGYVLKMYQGSVSVRVDTCSNSRDVKGVFYVSCQNKCPEQYERVKVLIKDRKSFGRFLGRGAFTDFVKDDIRAVRSLYYYMLTRGKRLKNTYYSWLRQRLPQENASLIASMLFGDTQLSQDTVTLMKEIGIVHVIAISGVNITYLLLVVRHLCSYWPRVAKSLIEVVVLVALYFVVGEAVSLIRALIMSFWGIFTKKAGFPAVNWSFLLGLSVVLLIDPRYLWDAGFQLVSAACFGVYICVPALDNWVKNKFLQRIGEALVVWGCVVPVQFALFHKIPLSGVVVGFLISPFVEGITIVGYCSVVLKYVPAVADMSRVFLGVLSSLVLLVVHLFHV